MKIATAAAFSVVLALGAATPVSANPRADVCTFVQTLNAQGVSEAVGFLESLAGHWEEDTRAQLADSIGAVMSRFTYRDGQVYAVADLPGSLAEFLVTLNLSKYPGSVYARLLFESNGKTHSFASINFQADYDDIVAVRPTLQPPVAVDCASPG